VDRCRRAHATPRLRSRAISRPRLRDAEVVRYRANENCVPKPLAEQHRRALRLLAEYAAYYHDDRTHLGLDKQTPRTDALEDAAAGRGRRGATATRRTAPLLRSRSVRITTNETNTRRTLRAARASQKAHAQTAPSRVTAKLLCRSCRIRGPRMRADDYWRPTGANNCALQAAGELADLSRSTAANRRRVDCVHQARYRLGAAPLREAKRPFVRVVKGRCHLS
jgi:hypothetical protein